MSNSDYVDALHKDETTCVDALPKTKAQRGRPVSKPVAAAVAAQLGIHRVTFYSRMKAISAQLGREVDVDLLSPDELEEVTRLLEASPTVKRRVQHTTEHRSREKLLEEMCLCMRVGGKPELFRDYLRDCYPKPYSLDVIRAAGDWLLAVAEELESVQEVGTDRL